MPVTNNTWWPNVTSLTAKQLLEQGYKQVSAKYCMLARLPEGKTGKQALADIVRKRKAHIEEEIDQWVEGLGEQEDGRTSSGSTSSVRSAQSKASYKAEGQSNEMHL